MASSGELVTILTETIQVGENAPGVIEREPTLGLIESTSGSAPNIVFVVDWDEGSRTATLDAANALLLRAPSNANALLLGAVMQPKGGGIEGDPGDSTVPSRSAELRGVVVVVALAQVENGSGVVNDDFGDVVLVRVGVPPVDQEGPEPEGQWYFAKVADMVLVPNA